MAVKGAFEKARLYIESHSQLSRDSENKYIRIKPGPCVTLSRETGAGADLVGEALVNYFSELDNKNTCPWTFFDRNLIERILEDHHLPSLLEKYLVEDKLPHIQSAVNEMLGLHPSATTLFKKTTETIHNLAGMGNVVIVGRGANIIAGRMHNAFHVRLVAPPEERIKHLMDIHGIDRHDAILFMKKEDAARRNYLMNYFHKNVDDPLLYHMVLNTHDLGHEGAAKVIVRAVQERFPQMFRESEHFMHAHV